MKDIEIKHQLQNELCQYCQEDRPCNKIDNVSIMIHKEKVKIRKKNDLVKYSKRPIVAFRLSRSGGIKTRKPLTKHISMTEINKRTHLSKQVTRSYEAIHTKPFYTTKYVVNQVSGYHFNEFSNLFNFSTKRKWKVYRCQLSARLEDSCCCSCNSDAMFEVMKSLYDCYKKKNCDNCNCILCSHLAKEERRHGEERKSLTTLSAKEIKRIKLKEAQKMLEGKTSAEKENILRELVKTGHPIPKGKTASEKALIKKVRAQLKVPESKTTTMLERIKRGKASQASIVDRLRKPKTFITPLEGKPPEEQERIIRGLAMQGLPLPEGKTATEKRLIEKVRAEVGLPPEPKSSSMRKKYAKAADAGLLQPLEGKSPQEKKRILQGLHKRGIPLPQGRTSSEKALIAIIKAGPLPPSVTPSERLHRAEAAGLLTPLEGKPLEEKERIIRGLGMQGLPLPEAKTAAEKKLIEKVRADLGLPPEPKSTSIKERYAKAADAGLLQPLEGKSPQEKKRILQGLYDRGIPLPEGRTSSERALIAKIKAGPPPPSVSPSERLQRAEAAGLLTPLEGKPPEEKERILRGLAMQGLPLPEAKTATEKKLIERVRADLGLPPEPKSTYMKQRYAKAANAGLLQPLEGKSPQEKKIILQGLHDRGIPLPQGRTSSERALIAKIKAGPPPPSVTPSERLQRAEAAGLITPLTGKPPEEQERIIRELAMHGLPLPEGRTATEKKLIDRVRADLGLPPEPKSSSMRKKYAKAADAGLLQPLENKSPQEKKRILQGLYDRGIPLPQGRTLSERALIAKIKAGPPPPSVTPSERLQRAEAVGLLTPLEGKLPDEQERIIRGLAMQGLPLPEGRTATEKRLIDRVRADLGLPPEPKSASMKQRYAKAADAGLMQPLEGKSPQEKKKKLQALYDRGIPLPQGRTSSERALIAKIKAGPPPPSVTPSERLQRAEAAGLLTPLKGKPPEEQERIIRELAMHGLPLPEGRTATEKKLIDRVRADLGLPPEPKSSSMRKKYAKAADAGLLQPLENKSPQEKKRILQGLYDRGIPLPEGRTSSERALISRIKAGPSPPSATPSERIHRAEAAGLLTPLEGKPPEEQERIIRGLAMQGLPLPEGRTATEKRLIDRVRADLGLPPEPKSASMKQRYAKAADAGLMQPLEGKLPQDKKRILQGLYDRGIPLPQGRTSSERALIGKIKAGPSPPSVTPSERLQRAKAAGLLTPLKGKPPEEQERIIRGVAMQGLPLPEGRTATEKKLIDRIRADLGLPPEPKSSSMRKKYAKAADAGLLQPLENKSPQEKKRILQGLYDRGIPLPEGRTSSERALISRIKAGPSPPSVTPSERIHRAEAAGLLTPLEGKPPAEQERIIRGLAMQGLPLPEGRTATEKKLIDRVRADLGLPPEPKSASMKQRYAKAADDGLMQPLEGKSPQEKKRILQGLYDRGITLPQGRTSSERALIAKVKAGPPPPSVTPSERLQRAEAAGLLTPLEGKPPEEQERIIRGLAMQGLPLPEGRTTTEKQLIDRVRADLGLPPEPKTSSMRKKYAKAADAGLLQPLQNKSPQEKKKILQGLYDRGIPLPEGRTSSERALISRIKAGPPPPSVTPSERIHRAEAAGLLTPLEGKPPDEQERIIRGLAMQGLPLPVGRTATEKKLISRVRADLGLPPEPKSASMKQRYAKAADAGLLQPLEGKTPQEKKTILQEMYDRGIPLPEGRTSSERALISKIKAGPPPPSVTPSERLHRAEAAGLLTPLEGKPPEEQERIIRGLAMQGLPLPEGRTTTEKKLIDRVRADLGLPPEPKSSSMRKKYAKAADAGILKPLEGKSPQEKKRILQGLYDRGISLPEGRTSSERALIAKIKAGPPPPSVTPSERIHRAEAAGLLTPLEGKPPDEQVRIIRGLAMQGLPLPEGRNTTEKRLIDRVRADLGLPPEPKSASMKQRYAKAADAGLMQPLEGKSPQEKKRILQGLYDRGILLPEGRTSSERALISKVKAGPPPPSVTPSERLQRAEAAGLLTPLEGKPPEEQERIIRGLAMQGLPLPEGRTTTEKNLIDRVRADLGLPPEPKSSSMRKKYAKAADAGILKPLEGKSPQEKKRILQGLYDRGIPLPEGRTSSERALISRIKAGPSPPSVTPSERIHRAEAAGLLTPLEGKPPDEQVRIIRGLAMQGLPLPEGRNTPEKRLIDRVRADLGLPPEPKSASMKQRYAKAADAGLMQPLEGKSPQEKKRILQGLYDRGILLPEGRTSSERALISKVKAGPPPPSVTPSERLQRAEAAGLLTPLEGKPPEEQERIIRGLAMQGLPLPEGRTTTEKNLIDRVRADLGLPPEPKSSSMRKKYAKAADAGILKPLEGKSPQEKKRILQGLYDRGIPLPEGRTSSERALISRIKAGPSPPSVTPSERIHRAEAAGLLTPLEGKPPDEQERIIRGLAMQGLPLPEGRTGTEKRLIDRVRADLGLPPEPKSASMKQRYAKAADAGLLQPLEGKTPQEKKTILQGMYDRGIPLPEGRTSSERALISKIKAGPPPPSVTPSERLQRAEAAGLLTPLEGKRPEEQERIIRGLAMQGLPLPEGRTTTEKNLIDRVRADLGLPPEPKSSSMRKKYAKAADAGILKPLEGESPQEKKRILQGLYDRGIPLPEGRTSSERALISRIKAGPSPPSVTPSERIHRAEAAGLLTPLEGKPPDEQERIIRGLAMQGLPLPEGRTGTEKRLIDRVRADLGLPPEPKSASMKQRYAKAADAGLLQPLEGKTPQEKKSILQGMYDRGIPLPEGRTSSERALISKIKAGPPPPSVTPSERLQRAEAAGLLTPLEGKRPEEQERIIRGLAMQGLPLPEGKTTTEKKLIDRVRADLGLPPEPKSSSMRKKYAKAADAGILKPLEGKSPQEKNKILQGLYDRGIPLPEGRTSSERALISRIKAGPSPPSVTPSERIQRAEAAGLLTPLEGKPPDEQERIIRGLAMQGLPLPEGRTGTEKRLIDRVRADLGLPPEPKSASMKQRYAKAADAGLLQPLEGKTPQEKKTILQGMYDRGIPLPEGRTSSERALIDKIRTGPLPPSVTPSERLHRAEAAGLLTPLEGKPLKEQERIIRGLAMQGLPLPEGRTATEKKLIENVRADLGLPPEPKSSSMRKKYAKAADAGILKPLEGKSPQEKNRILQGLYDRGIPLPEGRTSSERALIDKIRTGPLPPSVTPSERLHRAEAAGLLTPLEGKPLKEQERIIRGLAMQGLPLPEGKTATEKKLIENVRADLGLPPEPKSSSMRKKYAKAADAGILKPLEGKTPQEKKTILQGLYDRGIPLPQGRTSSERALIAKIKAGPPPPSVSPSERLQRAEAAGLLTPLVGKPPEEQERIIRGLAMQGLPLPEGRTTTEKKLIDRVRADLGLSPEPKTSSMRKKYAKAADAGLLQPLENKSPQEKKRILQGLYDRGIPLPKGRTSSERALIDKIRAGPSPPSVTPSERLHRAEAAGLLTPLEGKPPNEQERIIRGLAMQGLPLPEGKTATEKKLIENVRADLGLPPEPKSSSMRKKYAKAADAGILKPLEGKSSQEKKRILQGLYDRGIPLPEGRTSSERALIAKIKAGPPPPSVTPSERLQRAEAAGLLTPLKGKLPEEQERIIRALAMQGLPLPEGRTTTEKKLIDRVRADLGLPPEPKTSSMRKKYAKAADAGLLQPLEDKSPQDKKRILQGLYDRGIPLPEGRTSSERAIIDKIRAGPPPPSVTPSERLHRAEAAGLLTPLEGKPPDEQERIIRGLAMQGLPLPEGRTATEKKLIENLRADLGLPPEPKSSSMRKKYAKAADAGILKPLEGKSAQEKKRILQGLYDRGIPLPQGRTSSERALIAKIKAGPPPPSVTLSERLQRAEAAGLLTPLVGKSPDEQERIIRGLAMQGLPLPEGRTATEKRLIDRVRADLGLPPEPKSASMKQRYAKAADAGLLQPLEGKTPQEKKTILQGLYDRGILLPEGRTSSERALISKIKAGPPPPSVTPSERLQRAKAAGLLTPLEGKPPKEQKRIIRGLAMQGLPLPEGRTTTEKKLIDRVRADLGLPPEPKTSSMRKKYAKAADAGLLQALEDKSPQEKKRILQGLYDRGIPLPQGRTSSERALIDKIRAGPPPPSVTPSERLQRADAAGLLTPIEGKSPEEQERIIRGLALQGLPLPEGRTATEKRIIENVRAGLGLPPEPESSSMRKKYAKAADAGILQPLEGKSPQEKKRILQGLYDRRIPLPQGRTSSERALIDKIRAGLPPPSVTPSERLQRADAAGLLTPIEGKSPEEQERIIRGLALQGLPLPEGRTATEKRIIENVRAGLGLPPEPESSSMRKKYAKAADAGILQPLEGKSPQEKKRILQGLYDRRIPLPQGRTSSERALIDKIRAGPPPPSVTPSERLQRADAAGLLTPIEGKSSDEQERIIRGLAMQGLPLPEGRTSTEKRIIENVRADLGLPPEPKSSSMRKKYAKAADAGILKPLEGKSPQEKKRILQGLYDRGIPLPEGRTSSERALINKIRAGPLPPSVTPSERLHRADAAGLLTPLEGKSPEEKERIIRGLAMHGVPLPEGRTATEKKLIDRVRVDLGLPPEPESSLMRKKYAKAADAGILKPLEGKSPQEKKRILQGLYDRGIPLPEGRTSSERALINKIRAGPPPPSVTPSERLQRAEAAGLLTPLVGKPPDEQERIIRGLAMQGLPLPEGRTATEKRLIDRVRADLGLPPEPKSTSMKQRYAKAADAGLLQPLEGKTPQEKKRILQGLHDIGISLPQGRTSSERALIAKIKAGPPPPSVTPSERLQRAEAAGLLTPLTGKRPEEQERIIRELAKHGLPLPEGRTATEKKLIDRVRADLGLPPEPKSSSMRQKYAKAADAGILQPLADKSPQEKKRILQGLYDRGIPLPEGRTSSERALIDEIRAGPPPPSVTPSERLHRAEAAGLLTPIEGKPPDEQERIIRGLAMQGLPLPEGRTATEKRLIENVRADLGLPPEPKSSSMRKKYANAADAGILKPLEGKSPQEKKRILQGLYDRGIPLPEGRTSSERALIDKIKAGPPPPSVTPSERLHRAEAAGLLTPLEGKPLQEKERIIRGLAMQGLPLPEGKTATDKKLLDRVRADLGLPPEPKSSSMRKKYAKAADAGLLQPLEDKSPQEKKRILQGLYDRGIPLPEGRTSSERALIAKIKAGPPPPSVTPSERIHRAEAAGLLTPLKGKRPEQKERILRGLAMQGLLLPEGKTRSEKKLVEKVRADLGLPPEPKSSGMREKYAKAADAGLLQPLEDKTPQEKKRILQGLYDRGIPLPEGRTLSERALIAKIKAGPPPPSVTPSERIHRAEAAGLLTPLEGKRPEQKERILRGLAMQGLLLPEGKTASEKKLVEKVRADLGLPPGPKTSGMREKYAKAADDGLLQPLEGKSSKKKKIILQGLHDRGIPLPDGRTASEKALIRKIKAGVLVPSVTPSERIHRAKAAGLLTPLEGKRPEQKERILRGLAMQGLPLPEGRTASEKKLIDKIRTDLGLPPEPKFSYMREKYAKAADDGFLQPLEGKSPKEKKRILQGLQDRGIPLPEGRTSSEKFLISKVKAGLPLPSVTPSERMHRAKAAGLLTPLEGKRPEQKERILRGLAMQGLLLPEGKTASEKKLVEKVRADLGLPPEPKSSSMKEKYAKAANDGFLQPLEGKSPQEKKRLLQGLYDRGIPLPEGRSASEKALIHEVKAGVLVPSVTPSERIHRAKAAGLLTPLEGKTYSHKERILKGLAMEGLPLPIAKTVSEKKLAEKVRVDLGLPPEPKTLSMKEKYEKARKAGLLQPLEGKSQRKKENILRGLHDRGIPLPEGRTPSEEALIAKVKYGPRAPSVTPSERIHRAKAAGLLTPLDGKRPDQQEKILRGQAMQGLLLPEGKTASQKKLVEKVRADLGLPPDPKTSYMKEKYAKAADAGLLKPLEGKSLLEKTRILKGLHDRGIPLPEGRTASEKSLIAKVKEGKTLPYAKAVTPSITTEKLKKAKAAGLLTPLEGKSPEKKEKILKDLAKLGLPLPPGKTASEKSIIKRIKKELQIPERTASEKIRKAKKTGLLTPLQGKTLSQKEKILRGRAAAGLPLPAGKTPSERALVQKIKRDTGYVSPTPSERIKRAKDAGVLTPLDGKSPSTKEKILRERMAAGVPMPEGKTASETELIRKVIAGESATEKRPSEKLKQARTASERENLLKRLHRAGKPLPVGKTDSEKQLIARIKAESRAPSKITSEKLQKAREAGLLTPLTGKSPREKERILKGLLEKGLPLPESQTESEKMIAEKVRKELGLPPEPKTLSEKRKMHRAEAAGIVTPLEGKTSSHKERIVRGMVAAGIPLPEGRTASEKSMIKRVKAEGGKVPPKAASGLLTPLEGKTLSQKEKIIRGRAEAGMPLPTGKTTSEKVMIQKIRAELGLPPPAITASEKQVVHKARAEGLLTPIAGKTAKEKARILRGLADAGLPLPEGKTASERELVRKVRAEAGLPLEPTPSEKKGKIKSRSKRIGISPSKRRVKASLAGITEKFEDIIKTTTCDRGCGCDKKKIRFKHSYVKIRVTSPDISSLCDCPDECLPGVKAGAFIDNEGIKVTVGRVDNVTSFTSQFSLETPKSIITLYDNQLTDSYSSNTSTDTVDALFDNTLETNDFRKYFCDVCSTIWCPVINSTLNHDLDTSCTISSCYSHTDDTINEIENGNSNNLLDTSATDCSDDSNKIVNNSRQKEPSKAIFKRSSYILQDYCVSYDSITLIKSESSLSLTTDSSDSMDGTSMISLWNSSHYTSSSTHVSYHSETSSYFSDGTVEGTERFLNRIDSSGYEDRGDDTMTSSASESVASRASTTRPHAGNREHGEVYSRRHQNDYFVYTLSQTKLDLKHYSQQRKINKTDNGEPLLVVSNLDNGEDITSMVDQLIAKNEFSDSSSIFIVVPSSDDNDSISSSVSSTICIQASQHCSKWNKKQLNIEEPNTSKRHPSTLGGLKISAKGKMYCLDGMKETVGSFHHKEAVVCHKQSNLFTTTSKRSDKGTKTKISQVSTTPLVNTFKVHGVSTDTTSDRPCCCAPKPPVNKHETHKRRYAPLSILVNQGLHREDYGQVNQVNVTQQVSYMSLYNMPASINPCIIPPCLDTPRHQDECPQTVGMPKSQKTVSEKKQADPCSCSPEKIKEMFEEVLKGKKTSNLKSIQQNFKSTPQKTVTSGGVKIITFDTDDETDCGKCAYIKDNEGKTMHCDCSGKRRKVKLDPLCPCEQHRPPVGDTSLGPKLGTRSTGCQCCTCHDSTLGSDLGALGPAAGTCNMDAGGIYCQVGQIQALASTIPNLPRKRGKECICKSKKKGKKKKNIICECPPTESEPEVNYEAYTGWFDEKEFERQVLKEKSSLTQTQSGFRFLKRKKPKPSPALEEEYSVEDAVRYYVSIKPSLIKGLFPESEAEDCPCNDDDKSKKKKKKKKEVDCECSLSPSTPPGQVPPLLEREHAPETEHEQPSGGFKFSIGGKGSGSKGLSGVCCFDMIQETKISSSKHFN